MIILLLELEHHSIQVKYTISIMLLVFTQLMRYKMEPGLNPQVVTSLTIVPIMALMLSMHAKPHWA